MPHAVIEYTANICSPNKFAEITQMVHDVMIESALFKINNIKTCAYRLNNFLLGEKGDQGSFVHITIQLMEGRTILQKQSLADSMLNALKTALEVDHLTINIQEISKDIYRQHVHM